jgi:hypothetical protein
MLLARGWSQRQVALVLYGVCAAFGLVAMVFTTTGSRMTGFVMFVISVTVIIAVGHLRYHEVDEIKAGVRRTVGERRLRVANNIRVRRAARALSKADDFYELFEAVRQMLAFGEFTFADAQVGQAGRAEINERAFETSGQRHPKQQLEFRNGRIFWSWAQEGTELDDLPRSLTSWCLHLPLAKAGVEWGWLNLYRNLENEPLLVDPNYLIDLFRQELTDAAERILKYNDAMIGSSEMRVGATPEKITG